jgi:hypothetical protein
LSLTECFGPDLPARKLAVRDALILSAPPSDALIEAKVWLLRSFGRETLERAEQIKGNRKKKRKRPPKRGKRGKR